MEREGLSYTIAKNITELRRAHGLTQAALAEKLDYSDKSVSKWERAEGLPDVICLKRIADLFGVTVDYLLREEHYPEEGYTSVKLRGKAFDEACKKHGVEFEIG